MEVNANNIVETEITVELYLKDGVPHVYLSNDGSSGCSYKIERTEQIGELVSFYIQDLIEEGR